jgi:hypothetical protein
MKLNFQFFKCYKKRREEVGGRHFPEEEEVIPGVSGPPSSESILGWTFKIQERPQESA